MNKSLSHSPAQVPCWKPWGRGLAAGANCATGREPSSYRRGGGGAARHTTAVAVRRHGHQTVRARHHGRCCAVFAARHGCEWKHRRRRRRQSHRQRCSRRQRQRSAASRRRSAAALLPEDSGPHGSRCALPRAAWGGRAPAAHLRPAWTSPRPSHASNQRVSLGSASDGRDGLMDAWYCSRCSAPPAKLSFRSCGGASLVVVVMVVWLPWWSYYAFGRGRCCSRWCVKLAGPWTWRRARGWWLHCLQRRTTTPWSRRWVVHWAVHACMLHACLPTVVPECLRTCPNAGCAREVLRRMERAGAALLTSTGVDESIESQLVSASRPRCSQVLQILDTLWGVNPALDFLSMIGACGLPGADSWVKRLCVVAPIACYAVVVVVVVVVVVAAVVVVPARGPGGMVAGGGGGRGNGGNGDGARGALSTVSCGPASIPTS
jgi:hypothetical protein